MTQIEGETVTDGCNITAALLQNTSQTITAFNIRINHKKYHPEC